MLIVSIVIYNEEFAILRESALLPRNIDLLIFDLDGTLADTLKDLANAVNYALEKLGRERLELQTVRKFIGDGVKKFLMRALENPDTDLLEKGLHFFKEYYTEHVADFTTLYPGVQETLAYFSQKKQVVLTNKPIEYALPIVKRLQIEHYFGQVIGGNSGFPLKPDPEGILNIIRHHNVEKQRALIIGDSENDILGGQNAGIATCAVTFGFRPEKLLRSLNPDYVIDDLKELRTIII